MLNLPKCILMETYTEDTHSEVAVIEEGSALVFALEGGIRKVRPATGASGEVFAGFSVDRPDVPTNVPIVETFTVPASMPYTVTLGKGLVGTSLRVTNLTGGNRTAMTSGSVADGVYSRSGNVLTFAAAQAGQKIEVAYRYAITVQEAIYRYNFDAFAALGKSNIGRSGICSTGVIYTDKYDVTADWATLGEIRTGANGEITVGGSGGTTDCLVVEVPSSSNGGMLGISVGQRHS